jgi:hypothetical protein
MSDRIFIPTRDVVDELAVEQIHRALLTFHDVVYVRSSLAQSGLAGARLIAELREAGLVQLIGLESDPAPALDVSDVVLASQLHIDLAAAIDEAVSARPFIPSDGLPDPERTSRIVERRVMLWNVSLATHLTADLGHFMPRRLLTEDAVTSEGAVLGLELDVSDLLFALFRVPSVGGLSVEELITLRRDLPKARRQIKKLVDAHRPRTSDPSERQQSLAAIEAGIYELQDELLDALARSRGVQGGLRTGAGLFLDVAALFFYPASFAGVFADLAEFLWNTRKDRLVLYMHSISRSPGVGATSRSRFGSATQPGTLA